MLGYGGIVPNGAALGSLAFDFVLDCEQLISAFDGFDDGANFASLEAYSSIARPGLEREIVLMLSGKVTRSRNSEQRTRRVAPPLPRATQFAGSRT